MNRDELYNNIRDNFRLLNHAQFENHGSSTRQDVYYYTHFIMCTIRDLNTEDKKLLEVCVYRPIEELSCVNVWDQIRVYA